MQNTTPYTSTPSTPTPAWPVTLATPAPPPSPVTVLLFWWRSKAGIQPVHMTIARFHN